MNYYKKAVIFYIFWHRSFFYVNICLLKEIAKERFYIMKDMKNFIGKVTAKIAYDTAEKNANSICTWVFYQPKLPEKVKKLRKF